jgi:hypothetical protein
VSDQHFEPGPVLYTQQTGEDTAALNELLARLLRASNVEKKEREFVSVAGGQTDATGFLRVKVEYPQGFAFHVHRINLEAINPATGLSYTPAAPFTAGWVGIYRGEPGFGGLIDFAPPSPGANVFPQISTDGNKQAAVLRGELLYVVVNSGPISSAVHIAIGGRLTEL